MENYKQTEILDDDDSDNDSTPAADIANSAVYEKGMYQGEEYEKDSYEGQVQDGEDLS